MTTSGLILTNLTVVVMGQTPQGQALLDLDPSKGNSSTLSNRLQVKLPPCSAAVDEVPSSPPPSRMQAHSQTNVYVTSSSYTVLEAAVLLNRPTNTLDGIYLYRASAAVRNICTHT